jgi:probable HAF family extracellular repeat protein
VTRAELTVILARAEQPPRRNREWSTPVSEASGALQLAYQVEDLGPLPPYASASYGTALNQAGQVVGYAWESGYPRQEGFVWTPDSTQGPPENPRMRALGNLRGDDYWHNSQAWALNDRGLVVGWANGTDTLIDQTHGFVWQDGAMTDLGTLREQGFGASMARDVNDTGVVVGWSDTQAGTLDTNRHATLWRDAVITDLGIDRSWLNSINQFGQAVGAYFTADWDKHGLLWDPTHGPFDLHDLVTLGGASSEAAALNDAGQVVGWASDQSGTLHGFCLDLAEGTVRHLGSQMESLATGVNEAGLVIGRYKYSWLTDHPLAWDPAADAVTDLNDGISQDAGWTVFEAWGVNDTGQVTGFGTAVIDGIYNQRGYLLTPRPAS